MGGVLSYPVLAMVLVGLGVTGHVKEVLMFFFLTDVFLFYSMYEDFIFGVALKLSLGFDTQ